MINLRVRWSVAHQLAYTRMQIELRICENDRTADLDGWRLITGIDLNILYTTRVDPADVFLSPVSTVRFHRVAGISVDYFLFYCSFSVEEKCVIKGD